MTLLSAVRDCCVSQGIQRTYWIAYSGGMDSHVLLMLCAEIRKTLPIDIRAIHINHQLSHQATNFAMHCAAICRQLNIPLVNETLQCNIKPGESLEAVARSKRYASFARFLRPGDVLLTAHHQDDQAETMLIQLLRGSGPKGLAAMAVSRSFAQGYHIRPLLSFSRAELENYAISHQLVWIEDESNQNSQLTRNFIRHEILPCLKKRWPSVAATLARSAKHCAEAQVILEDRGVTEWQSVKGSHDHTLSVTRLRALAVMAQKLILRTWCYQRGFPLPDSKKLNSILQQVLTAKWDRQPCVRWHEAELRRQGDDLYLVKPMAMQMPMDSVIWDFQKPLFLPTVGTLQAAFTRGVGLSHRISSVSVRFRQGGETLQLAGRRTHTLKNLFQEWKVPAWERSRVPLLFVNDTLVAVVGYAIDARFVAAKEEIGMACTILPAVQTL